jgi:hypothetical protein
LSLLLLLLKRLLRLKILKIGERKLRRQIELGLDLSKAGDRLLLRYSASLILGLLSPSKAENLIIHRIPSYGVEGRLDLRKIACPKPLLLSKQPRALIVRKRGTTTPANKRTQPALLDELSGLRQRNILERRLREEPRDIFLQDTKLLCQKRLPKK